MLDQGYKVLLSSPWYINYIGYGESWRSYYMADPILSLPNSKLNKNDQTWIHSCLNQFPVTTQQEGNILGGEACIWAEFVDKTNIVPRLFPFVGAIAERLWSHNISIDDEAVVDARDRLDQFRCKMIQ